MTKGINENIDQNIAKYHIHAIFSINGVVEVQDVIGALFGQTEGLLNDLDLRELQKSGRIGRIVVNTKAENGITSGEIIIPSSLDRTETAILAATLETVDRVGPCSASLKLKDIKDLRASKLKQIEERAKELLKGWKAGTQDKEELTEKIQDELEKAQVVTWNGLPAGSNLDDASAIIIVEGRNDIQQLFKIGVKNTVAVNGTSIPKVIVDLTNQKECWAFVDGDRGGEMILNELIQTSKIKFVTKAPPNREVEELTPKELVKCLQQKQPIDEFLKQKKSQEEQEPYKREEKDRGRVEREPRRSDRHPKANHRDQGNSRNRNYDNRSPRDRNKHPVQVHIPQELGTYVKSMISSNAAIALDEKNQEIFRSSNTEIYKNLSDKFSTVIIDGVISQRFLEKAVENKIKRLIAVNTQNKLEIPENISIEIFYFRDFF